MFCYQCEQTMRGTACTEQGVCGKDATTAALQDLLVHAAKGIAMYARRARDLGAIDADVDRFVIEALFTTVTNVSFHPPRLQEMLLHAAGVRDRARALYEDAAARAGKSPETVGGPAAWKPLRTIDGLILQGHGVSIERRKARLGEDIAALQELVAYGLKGAAAYYDHALRLGKSDDALMGDYHAVLDALTRDNASEAELLKLALHVGDINYRTMELLDAGHVEAFGHPEPTVVRVEPVKGKAIVVSGHDLPDLHALLQQTEGKGINVYTHGEMLPAHGYPKLKAFPHLVGNYGGPWQNQVAEFAALPGAILMTTNCIQRPLDETMGRMFSSGLVAWPGVRHIADGDFAPVIEAALAAPGFEEDGPARSTMVGFGRNAVLNVAGQVIEAVKSGAIRRFVLIGGCDGAKPGRNYYTQLARSLPQDCVILTLACGKYRFNKLEFGTVAGLPRLMDVGQCNDAYSAIQIALALANAFDCGVNDLPLSLVLSWYEQKAVAILLTLLNLGIRGIRLGPSLPAFVTPTVLDALVANYGIKPISDVQADMEAILGTA